LLGRLAARGNAVRRLAIRRAGLKGVNRSQNCCQPPGEQLLGRLASGGEVTGLAIRRAGLKGVNLLQNGC
jgi:hypothetical protein